MKDAKIPAQKSVLEESYIVENGLASQAKKDLEGTETLRKGQQRGASRCKGSR